MKSVICRINNNEAIFELQNIDKPPLENGCVIVKNLISNVSQIEFSNKTDADFSSIGYSGIGEVVEVGQGSKFNVGDEVAFMRHSQGFCQEYSAVDNDSIIKIPLELDNKTVAASYFDGLMAHTLCKRVYALRQGAVVLIHNATSQVGYLLAQYSKLCGAVVIGTIDDDAKKDFALSHGCHYTVNHKTSDWSKEVLQITKGHGVNVAYCFSNKDLTKQIISCVTKMGIVSCYGGIDNQLQISNPREIFDNSLYITFPSIFDYKKNKMELILSADDLFNHILSKNLKISIDSEWNFENLDQLHTKLKQNNYSGSTVVYCS